MVLTMSNADFWASPQLSMSPCVEVAELVLVFRLSADKFAKLVD